MKQATTFKLLMQVQILAYVGIVETMRSPPTTAVEILESPSVKPYNSGRNEDSLIQAGKFTKLQRLGQIRNPEVFRRTKTKQVHRSYEPKQSFDTNFTVKITNREE